MDDCRNSCPCLKGAAGRKKVSETAKEYKVLAFALHYPIFIKHIHYNNDLIIKVYRG